MNNEDRAMALATHFGVSEDCVSEYHRYGIGDSPTFEVEGQPGAYCVLDNSEADEALEQALDSYIEECILPDLPASLRGYFDSEKWKRDARFDGRAHALNAYDGNEEEVMVSGEWRYIYRVE